MLKKIKLIFVLFLLSSCSSTQQTIESSNKDTFSYEIGAPKDMSTDYSNIDLGDKDSFRVAMILPLSGKDSSMGETLKNASMLALGDINNSKLLLKFYDSQSSINGAKEAANNAINDDSKLILGPLVSDEVLAISEIAKNESIPVISFSTSPNVLQDGIYSLGLLSEEQIDKIIHYAANNNRKNLALVVPNNTNGINLFKSAQKASKAYNINLIKVGFYDPNTMDFTNLVQQIVGPEKVKDSQKSAKEKAEDATQNIGTSEPVLADFDTLLVAESGNRLKAITSMFSYYDITNPDVLFLGTSVWQNTILTKETELYGAVYPVMSNKRITHFAEKYKDMFGSKPNPISVYAYDAVALASALSLQDYDNVKQNIVDTDGYYGMSGAFRLFNNGKNEHGLDVVKVTPSGPQVVESAQQKFYSVNPSYSNDNLNLNNQEYIMPKVFGKNAEELKKILNNNVQ